MVVRASVSLSSDSLPSVGRERIALLEAVAREGSISAGARAMGLTYKAAWDALDAMANVFGRPLLTTRAGGRAGGGAALTDAGRAVIAAYRRLEAELGRVLRSLEPDLAGTGLAAQGFLSGVLLRTSARNVLRGRIGGLSLAGTNAEVEIHIGGTRTIRAQVTRASVEALGLAPGREVLALVKAPAVAIVPPTAASRLPAGNCICGTVQRCDVEEGAAEVILDIGEGRTLAASLTAQAVAALGLAPGAPACAVFDPSHVILAID